MSVPINDHDVHASVDDDEEGRSHEVSSDLLSTNSSERKSLISKITRNITVEPMMLAHMIGIASSAVVVQNMYIDRICRVTHNFTEEICGNLSNYPKQEDIIETDAAYFTTYRGLIEAGFPILFSLFLGPWTDIHGTKYPCLLPLLGYFVSSMLYLTFSFMPNLPPQYLLFSSVPVSITGGMVALVMSVFSYVSKITTVENRSFRVAMLEASWFLGSPIGLICGGYIYKYGDFSPVFVTCGLLYALGFAYGAVAIKEEVTRPAEDEIRNCCQDMFNFSAVKEIFSTVIKERPGHTRRWIFIMLFAICLRIFVLFGYLNTFYLYCRHQFAWDLADYTKYSVADSFIGISGTYFLIMITMRIFHLNDCVIGMIGCVGSIAGGLVFGLAPVGGLVYFGSALSMFSGVISIVIRSMLSKVVAKEEIAKVFTFLSCGEASMPLLATPFFNLIYTKTKDEFAGTVFIFVAGLYLVMFIAFLYLFTSMRKRTVHSQFISEETEQE